MVRSRDDALDAIQINFVDEAVSVDLDDPISSCARKRIFS